jgi:hypothetical protein
MKILETIGATGERHPAVWASSITGIIVGGVTGATVGFGLMLQVTDNFLVLCLLTLIGWAAGAGIGGALGLLVGNFASRRGLSAQPARRPF